MPTSPDLLRSQVGLLGIIGSLALFVSHIPTYCQKIVNKEAKDEFPVIKNHVPSWICISHLLLILRSALWILYGSPFITQGNHLFAISHGIAFATELISIIIYLVHANKKQRFDVYIVLVCEMLAYSGLVLGLRFAGVPQPALALFTGDVCVILDAFLTETYCMFQSADLIYKSTKCLEQYASSWPLLADFNNSMIWWIFALLSNNPVPSDNKIRCYDLNVYIGRCVFYAPVMLTWYVVYCVKSATKGCTSYHETSQESGNDVQVDTEKKQIWKGSVIHPDNNNV